MSKSSIFRHVYVRVYTYYSIYSTVGRNGQRERTVWVSPINMLWVKFSDAHCVPLFSTMLTCQQCQKNGFLQARASDSPEHKKDNKRDRCHEGWRDFLDFRIRLFLRISTLKLPKKGYILFLVRGQYWYRNFFVDFKSEEKTTKYPSKTFLWKGDIFL